MILIDATYINNGGGRVLLDYLIDELEKTDLKVFYLLDNRINEGSFKIKDSNKIIYKKASVINRFFFYYKNKEMFTRVFVFGNIPPPVKLQAKVFTYFHNHILLNVPTEFPIIEKIKYKLKVLILFSWKKNTDSWLLQSEILKEQFIQKFKERHKVQVLPFYPSLKLTHQEEDNIKDKNTYLYVSNAQENKNHLRLIEAFCQFYDKHYQGKLVLTVSEKFPNILEIISDRKKRGYPILNLGFIKREDLISYYLKSEYVIFPSLAESYGLGIIEGVEFGCKVIGSDLPYTYAVCNPSLVFNPKEIDSIVKAFELSLKSDIPKSELKTSNQIDVLIDYLK